MMPERVDGPYAWKGDSLNAERWQRALDASDLVELERALEHALRLGVEPTAIVRDGFPLPTLASKFARAHVAIEP